MAQLDDVTLLWDTLRDYLDFCLMVNTNRTYWDHADIVSNDDLTMYEATITDALGTFYEKYQGTKVEKLLEQLEYAVYASVRTGMSVAYPRHYNDPYAVETHIDRVVANTMQVVDDFYDDLRYEIFIVNRRAKKIQKLWKEVNSNPGYSACRNRLCREFNDISA